jgi:hypothetical protein
MASATPDEFANARYHETEKRGSGKQNIPTVVPTAQPPATHRRERAVPDTELTLTVHYVSGPEAESLARTQYAAITEVLQWLSNQQEAA